MGRIPSKELLEEIGDVAALLFTFHLAGGVGAEDGPAENNPPALLFFDHLHIQRFAAIEHEGACDHHHGFTFVILIKADLIYSEILGLDAIFYMIINEIVQGICFFRYSG